MYKTVYYKIIETEKKQETRQDRVNTEQKKQYKQKTQLSAIAPYNKTGTQSNKYNTVAVHPRLYYIMGLLII